MVRNANPQHSYGERNVFCPHYGGCLNYASKLRWETWSCEKCGYRKETEPLLIEKVMDKQSDDSHQLENPRHILSQKGSECV